MDDLVRRAVGADLAILDEIAPRGDLERLAHVVVRQENAYALIAQSQDDLADVRDRDGIDAGEGLVQEDQQRLANQAAGDLQTPLLAAGASRRGVFADPRQAKLFQDALGSLPALAARQRPAMDDRESPLLWLYRRSGKDGQAQISDEEFAAGERFRADITLAQMLPRTTMNWDAALTPDDRGAGPRDSGLSGLSRRAGG